MSEAVRLDPGFSAAASNEDRPKVLSRLVTAPAAAPWEQARAARLEARLGAPLPLAELTFQVKRLGGWRPGTPARFAVFYVRTRELRGPFEAAETVDGEMVQVAFGRSAPALPNLGAAPFVLLILALTGAVLGTAASLALRVRADSSDRIEAVERLASAKLAAAKSHRRGIDQARALTAAKGHGAPVSQALNDLAWAAQAKTPEARVVGFHWRQGVIALEVKGDPPPVEVADRKIQRAPKQLRPGVWLWGIGPPGSAPPGKVGP